MNEHLHFTINYDLSQISFLDVMVIKDKTSLSTDLYRKPTDRNNLLRGDSFLPLPLIKSLPTSQFSRIRRICSSDASYQKQTTDLTQRFKERGTKTIGFTYKCNSFTHTRTGKIFMIKGLITCMSTNGKLTQICEHRSNIWAGETKNLVAVHFVQTGHPISSLRYIGIEMVKMSRREGDIERKLLQRESFWIHRLNTLSPLGHNEEFDLKPFL
ncbi:unnamed protein product [Coregonus sp. 'balchen']|nr:unnamed protein product [Coregonus sp. 'balchen']